MFSLKHLGPHGSVNQSIWKLNRRQYQNQGLNFCWNLDGYDKLKPFEGFVSYGCIDGYSQKIIWFKAIHSNNDPFVVGTIFLHNVKVAKCFPNQVCSDSAVVDLAEKSPGWNRLFILTIIIIIALPSSFLFLPLSPLLLLILSFSFSFYWLNYVLVT